ncbi:hypothetical protein [Nostoc sp. NMS4]|nr:hypothetical protein [Nostoc sp. NMS4]
MVITLDPTNFIKLCKAAVVEKVFSIEIQDAIANQESAQNC